MPAIRHLAHRAVTVDRQIELLPCNVVVRSDPDEEGTVLVGGDGPQAGAGDRRAGFSTVADEVGAVVRGDRPVGRIVLAGTAALRQTPAGGQLEPFEHQRVDRDDCGLTPTSTGRRSPGAVPARRPAGTPWRRSAARSRCIPLPTRGFGASAQNPGRSAARSARRGV